VPVLSRDKTEVFRSAVIRLLGVIDKVYSIVLASSDTGVRYVMAGLYVSQSVCGPLQDSTYSQLNQDHVTLCRQMKDSLARPDASRRCWTSSHQIQQRLRILSRSRRAVHCCKLLFM